MYNSDIDLWFQMPDLNVGRHYHSSCAFQDKAVYVFCGIANSNRKYINSIEKYETKDRNKWTLIYISSRVMPERQGAGVVQKDLNTILIFGGFSGKFLSDCYLFNVESCAMTRCAPVLKETFLFQMPIIYDS